AIRPMRTAPGGHPRATRTPCRTTERGLRNRSEFGDLASGVDGGPIKRDAGKPRIPASPGALPLTTSRGWDRGGRSAALEVLADQELQRAEVSLREVLEAPPARGGRVVGRIEALDDPQQVLGVLAQLHLDGGAERRVAGQGQRGLGPVAVRLDQRAEAEPLEPLRHRAPVPA